MPKFAKEGIDNPSAGSLAFAWFKTEGDISMKTGVWKVYERLSGVALFLICGVALLALLPGTQIASAHDGDHAYTVTASQVRHTEDSVKNFVLHMKAHWDEIPSETPETVPELVELKNLSSIDGGDWRNDNDTTYIIRLRKDGTLIHQPNQPLAENGSLYDFEDDQGKRVMEELIRLAGKNEDGGCVEYVLNGTQRVSCAVEFLHPVFRETSKLTEILIGGLHHDFEDVSFAKATCPYYVPEITAAEVVDEETLKKFVKQFIGYYLEQRERIGGPRLIGFRHCWRTLPWKYGSIYLFFMPENQLVAFNGNTPELENKTLNLKDGNGVNVGDLILAEVNDPDSDGFVDYLWDDPTTTDDDVDITMCPDGPQTCAPGTTPKRTYVEKVTFQITETTTTDFIFGSGIYLEEKEDDGGCAIAGSANTTPKRTIFNLFFVVSLLFSAALWKKRSGEKRTMRKKGLVMKNSVTAFFVCTLALLVFFSAAQPASAHDGNHSDSATTASGVTAADPVTMKDFLLHAKAHWEEITTPNKNIEFEKSLTVDGRDWKNGTIYLMVIDKDGTIYTNAHDPSQQNGTLLHSSEDQPKPMLLPEVNELILMAEEGGCIMYEQRAACSVKFTHPVWKTELILIAGYHHDHEEHEETELSFDEIECPFFSKPISEKPYLTQGTTANEVVDSETLKAFVENFRDHFTEQVEKNSQSPAQLARIRNCWRIPPWKHGGIYLFIMTENGLVFFNGNGPDLENRSFNVTDDNGCNVGEEVTGVINGEARQCKDLGLLPEDSGGFIEYLWDDPSVERDEVTEPGMAPGRSPKLSYVVSFSNPGFFEGEKLVIGSGYHPETGQSDNGCAIAGADGTAENGLLNLFLAASVLLLSVFFVKTAQKTQNSR